jgi:tRNA threonylcarbamoyladenosine biosynthesis protein TsaB
VRYLAFETATRRLSVALWQDGEITERWADMPNSGSEVLLPWANELLAESGITFKALDGIAFGAGPGGFTGLRLACGVTQGLAFGLDVPVVPVSTLAALALATGERTGGRHAVENVWTCLDARMNEVYLAAYRVAGGTAHEVIPPQCLPPASVGSADLFAAAPPGDSPGRDAKLRAVLPAPTFLPACGAGDGFKSYGQVLAAQLPDLIGIHADIFPTASAVARLAARVFARGGGLSAELAQPIYVRDKVAFTTAERLARGGLK